MEVRICQEWMERGPREAARSVRAWVDVEPTTHPTTQTRKQKGNKFSNPSQKAGVSAWGGVTAAAQVLAGGEGEAKVVAADSVAATAKRAIFILFSKITNTGCRWR